MRIFIVRALGKIQFPEKVDALLTMSHDYETYAKDNALGVLSAIIEALGDIEDGKGLTALETISNYPQAGRWENYSPHSVLHEALAKARINRENMLSTAESNDS